MVWLSIYLAQLGLKPRQCSGTLVYTLDCSNMHVVKITAFFASMWIQPISWDQLLCPFKVAGFTQIQQVWIKPLAGLESILNLFLEILQTLINSWILRKVESNNLVQFEKWILYVLYSKMPMLAHVVTKHQNILYLNL